ncbi:MAG TPA: prepilin peptidase [Sphingomicrobium sp.]|nr:prepilin peptidase [Sphingomicrobium sp.]
MNLIVASPNWLTIPLLLLLLAAAIEDAARLKISNLTCGLVFVGALVAMAANGFSFSLWQNVLVCIVILTLGTPAFAAGWLGGGDVKLLASLGLWLDLQAAVGLIAAVFIAGGLLAIVSILGRRAGIWRRHSNPRTARIPYGIAIAAGAIFIFGVQLTQRPTDPFMDRMHALQAQHR